MQATPTDSVFVKEKASGKYVHFHPETKSYYTREGKVGACLFESEVVHHFIAAVLQSPTLYETEAILTPVVVRKDTEQNAYADIRARGYRG